MNSIRLTSTGLAAVCWLVLLGLVPHTATRGDESQNPGCLCLDTVGNVNCDYADLVTLGDVSLLLDHLYITGVRLPNLQEANIDADPEGIIELADVVLLIDHLFITKVDLPLCPAPLNAPPETRIVSLIDGLPFINDQMAGTATTGVIFEWLAQDLVDHPYQSPVFECEYRLYGPYSDSLLAFIMDSFTTTVFRPDPYVIIAVDQSPDTLGCDTVYVEEQIDTIICRTMGPYWATCDTSWDGGIREITCDTLLIDTVEGSPGVGRIDTILDVFDPDFVSNPQINRIACISDGAGDTWVGRSSDTLYDVFAGHSADTTQVSNFVFWVRARDPVDQWLVDPVPAFASVRVLDPQFERDVLVISWSSGAHENRVLRDSSLTSWNRAVDSWITGRGATEDITFDGDRDIMWVSSVSPGSALMETAVRYKILVLEQDAAVSGTWSVEGPLSFQIYTAIATGSAAWAAARVPIGGYPFGNGPVIRSASQEYETIFGLQQVTYTGWAAGFYLTDNGYGFGLPRIEDFIGAISEDTDRWPDLMVDTAFLRTRYDWQGSLEPPEFPYYPYMSEIGALPEVGWAEPSPDAEVMYRYRSLYGDSHPIFPELAFQGNPVMHRIDRNDFRTVHSLFTPHVLVAGGAQMMINEVLDWLYEPHEASESPTPQDFAGKSPQTIDLRASYLKWRTEWARLSIAATTKSGGTQ